MADHPKTADSLTKERFDWLDRLHADPNLSMKAKAGAYVISGFINRKSREAFPSQATLALRMGCSERTVRSAIVELCGKGYLEKRRGGFSQPNHYRMAFPPSIAATAGGAGDPSIPAEDCRTDDLSIPAEGCRNDSASIPANPCRSVRQGIAAQSGKVLPPNPLSKPSEINPLRGAALQAPATSLKDTPPLPPITEPPALRAPEGLRAGLSEAIHPDILEIIEEAELRAYDNPSLMRQDYSPPEMTPDVARSFLCSHLHSAWYREQAAKLRSLARAANLSADNRSRADLAVLVLLNHASTVDHATKVSAATANIHTFKAKVRRAIPLHAIDEDEVPF